MISLLSCGPSSGHVSNFHGTCRSFSQGFRRQCVRRQQSLVSTDSVGRWTVLSFLLDLRHHVLAGFTSGFWSGCRAIPKQVIFPSKHTPSQPQVNLLTATPVRNAPVHPGIDQPTTIWTFMSQSSSPIA
jgi:hypothetical protein